MPLTFTGNVPGGNFVVSNSLILLTAFTLFAKMSSNGNSSSVFNGNCSVNQTDGRKLRMYSFSLVCGGGATVETDLRGGAVTDATSTLFLGTVTHSRSSLTKLLCLL